MARVRPTHRARTTINALQLIATRNDILRRDGAVPAPYIVPISASLQRAGLRPLSYDGALELFSRPLMQHDQTHWSFGPAQRGEDGVTYNLTFDRYDDAIHAWRYPDLTRHVAFLADALETTIEHEMRAEAQYLQRHSAARSRLKTIVEGPDPALDRIIRSVRESRGNISGRLRAEYPLLERPVIREDVVRAIVKSSRGPARAIHRKKADRRSSQLNRRRYQAEWFRGERRRSRT